MADSGLLRIINRGIRFVATKAATTYVGLKTSASPTTSFDIVLPSALPSTDPLPVTMSTSGALQYGEFLSKVRYLFIMAGESNSGGLATNSTLTSIDLAAQPQLKIWNNTSSVFQSLQIGTNNLISHTTVTDNTTHSIERGLAREVLNTLQWPEAYLLKAGHGGSTIAQWSVGNASNYLSILTTRYNAAVAALTASGYTVRPILIWFNGINDAIAVTSPTTWRTATQAHFSQIRTLMGANTPIFMPQIMTTNANYTAINTEIATIDAADSNMWALATSGIAQDPNNVNHYTANGYLRIARELIDSLRSKLGVLGSFSIGQSRLASSKPVVSLKRSTIQTIAHNVNTAIVLNSIVDDTDNMFSSANGNVIIPTGAAGVYIVNGMVTVNAAQQVRAMVFVNGVNAAQSLLQISTTDNIYSGETTRTLRLNAGDVVALYTLQSNTTSSTRDLFIQPEFQASLQLTCIGQ